MKTKSIFRIAVVGLFMLVGCGSDPMDGLGAGSDESANTVESADTNPVSATKEQSEALAAYIATEETSQPGARDKGMGQTVARPIATCDDSVFGGTYCWSGNTYCWFSNAGGAPRCGHGTNPN